ncbi:MAG: M48 family metallopeptidase [Campylobacteraceae bacterium]
MTFDLFSAYYFDGENSKAFDITAEEFDNCLYLKELNKTYFFTEISVGPKLKNTAQKISFNDGSHLEIKDDKYFHLPNKKGGKFVLFLESKLKYALISFILIIAFGAFLLTFGSTFAANVISQNLPKSAVNLLSTKTLELLDKVYLSQSNVSEKTQNYLKHEFEKITKDSNNTYTLHFRSSTLLGANAFALPSGEIVLLDDLIDLDKDEKLRGILAVLAHEAGHVEYKHGLKSVVKASITSAVIGYFIGDFSGVATSLATFSINANYSREFEEEADNFAIKLMREQGISTKYIADIFEELTKKAGNITSEGDFLSTHPAMDKRIQKFREEG